MITKDTLLASLQNETRIIKHLVTKIPADRLHWRPTAGQRSVLELTQYLTRAASGIGFYLVNGNRDHSEAQKTEAEQVGLHNVQQALDRQLHRMTELLVGVSSADLANRQCALPWGITAKLGEALLETSVKFLTGYRMQLFLYLKQLGRTELNTANCWAGRDPAPVAVN